MRELVRQLIEGFSRDRELIVCQVVEQPGFDTAEGRVADDRQSRRRPGRARWEAAASRMRSNRKPSSRSASRSAAVHSFILDHDYAWADGLICGGKMVVLTQPMRGPGRSPISATIDR